MFGVLIDGGLSIAQGSNAGDTYNSIERLIGSDFVDQIFGFTGTVFGGAHNDQLEDVAGMADGGTEQDFLSSDATAGGTLRGNYGTDQLRVGGAGITRFWLEPNRGLDNVERFDSGQDLLRTVGDYFGIGPTLDTSEFTAGSYSGSTPQFRNDTGAGDLFFDFDGVGTEFGEILIANVTDDSSAPVVLGITDFEVI